MSRSPITSDRDAGLPVNSHPGENPARRVPEAHGPEPKPRRARHSCAAPPHQRAGAGQARGDGRHGPPRLARYFGVSEGFFLGLQGDFDLMERRRQIEADLAAITPRTPE